MDRRLGGHVGAGRQFAALLLSVPLPDDLRCDPLASER